MGNRLIGWACQVASSKACGRGLGNLTLYEGSLEDEDDIAVKHEVEVQDDAAKDDESTVESDLTIQDEVAMEGEVAGRG